MVWNIKYIGHFGSAVLIFASPTFLCTPPSLLVGQHEKLKSPWLSVSTALKQCKILVCYHHCFQQKCKARHRVSLYEAN